MSLLDLAGSLLGGGQNAGSGNLIGTVFQALNSQPGGIAGVLEQLQQAGLGTAVSSWISSGQNTPVSADQIHSALGGSVMQDIAAKLGVSPETAAGHLAEMLPGLVDHVTPNGQTPEGGFASVGLSMLSGLFAKATAQ